jgi:hypothetical protein
MPQRDDEEALARLSHLVQHGGGDDLEEIARLLGQTDPYVDPPARRPAAREAAPGLFARALGWFWRPG